MPRRSLRNRNVKRKIVVVPGGRTATHYHRTPGKRGICASCGQPLRGVESGTAKGMTKSSRRPSRPFGGTICHACLREMVRQGTRAG